MAGALAVPHEVSPRSLDAVAAIGEILSSRLVAALFADAEIPATAVDPRTLIVTDEHFTAGGAAAGDRRARTCDVNLRPVVTKAAWRSPAGSSARRATGVATTLGRGGSDYSAAIFGAASSRRDPDLDRRRRHADGGSARGRRLPARAVPVVAEAAELAYFGAKVLHPKTIQPAAARNIPVRILNTFRPRGAAARSSPTTPRVDAASVTALACKKGITVVTITSTGMLMAHGYMRRLFEIFERFRTSVDVVSTSEVSVSVTIDNVAHLECDRRRPVGVRRGQRRPRPGAGGGGGRPVRHGPVGVHPGRPGAGRHPAAAGVAGRRQAQRDAGDRRGRFVARDGPTSCRILPAGEAGQGFGPAGETGAVGQGFSPAAR